MGERESVCVCVIERERERERRGGKKKPERQGTSGVRWERKQRAV